METKTIKKKKSAPLWFTLLFFGCVIFLFVKMCGSSSDTNTVKDYHTQAAVQAQVYVKQKLKYPEEADFQIMGVHSNLIDSAKNTYRVDGFVTSKNGFGVKSKLKYQCELSYLGGNVYTDSSWYLDKCEVEE